ncbi:Uncharacterised protein [uncultured Comamonas sp.]|nr:Uncharacterised protein [uncultured Comamonas sp.]
MWLLWIAVVLAALKVLAHQEIFTITWVAQLSWWWVLGCFAVTAAWWAYADATGLTRRKAQERMDERKQERQRKTREALGSMGRPRRK